MPLSLATGQHSDAGRKPVNQDFHGLCVPGGSQLGTKGIAIALADGISSSEAGQQASRAAVRSFLDDYYCTSDAWPVKKAVERVLAATNSWLFAQTQRGQGRYDRDRGWACTFSAMVFKSRTAHLFHVGDARIYQLQGHALEQLTTDHRVHTGGGQSYLGRALGIAPHVEIDYRTVSLEPGDIFVLATDGVYEHLPDGSLVQAVLRHRSDLDAAARAMVEEALRRGSADNLTVQLVRVDALPPAESSELHRLASGLPLPPMLAPRMEFDGYRIVRELHASSRSHVHLATDLESGETVALKTPSIELRDDPAYVERFLLEEWVARRIASAHVLKSAAPTRRRNFLYLVTEYVEGPTLRQWMADHPKPDLETVRGIVEQLARGLRAMHRLEIVHQDLRPENVIVDATGTAKLIDFGSAHVAGLLETVDADRTQLLGTAQYAAPEQFLGEGGSPRSDQFSLAVIAYEMLTGRLPYGANVPQCRTLAQQQRLQVRPLADLRPDVPSWVEDALRKALHVQPRRRYQDLAEFACSLRRPDPDLWPRRRVPLIERDPIVFWKGVALLLALGWLVLAGLRVAGH